MDLFTWVQLGGFCSVFLLLSRPLGSYMARVYRGERTLLSPLLTPCEHGLYRICGVDWQEEMDWWRYTLAMLLFHLVGLVVLLGLLLTQDLLPLNPQNFAGFSWPLALNTAVSFVTNTNWQAYSGESAAGILVQMAGFTVQNFVSATTGMAIAVALMRGFARRTTHLIGNFWVDLSRGVLYILLPISLVAALLLVSQGVIQTFHPTQQVSLLQPLTTSSPSAGQETIHDLTLPLGPVASQEAIKELGTNGGGYFNANSAHPFENPTPLSHLVEILLILLIPGALTHTFGHMVGNGRQGWALFAVMLLLLIGSFTAIQWAETSGIPSLNQLGIEGGNMEGKEVRFGQAATSLFEVVTTATSCGAVTAMHDSLTPLGGLVPLSLMLLGEIVFGGVGSGLYTMLAFAIIAVFVAGLMIGRTPEYLGKKIEVREMWLAISIILTAGVIVLVFSAIALLTPSAVAAMANTGAHGLSEVLYGFASMANNNGSAFAGLNAATDFYTLTGALAMLLGRLLPAVAVLAMAGSLAGKKYIPPSLGTLPTDQAPFALWLTLVILIVGALSFFPVLALGPIAEHLLMLGGQ